MKKAFRLAAALIIAALISLLTLVPASAATGDDARADAFIEAVRAIGNATTVYDTEAAINYAKSEGVYFDDTSYDGVAEALATLASREAALLLTVEACESFVEYMSIADDLDFSGGSYTELRAALDSAAEYKARVDLTYNGVAAYLEAYTRLTSKLFEPEKTSRSYISCAERAVAAGSYKDKKQAYDDAMQFFDGVIPDYPGVSEATAALEAVDIALDELVRGANRFKAAVSAIGTGDNIYAEISAAYIALEGVDTTVTGVRASVSTFEGYVREIGAEIAAANAAQSALVSAVAPVEADSATAALEAYPAILPKRREG